MGRSRDGQPGRTEGFCPNCRNPFSFTPKLKAGDLVGGQYDVAGAIAHGGLGWIYLARDRNVSDRWVVLKGLLNSGDPDALAAAIAERQFLAQVEHPLIVEIYNFVTHEGAGYIVMEYVGGTSLKQILKERMRAAGGAYDPLPVDQAIAYILEILPAFQYLHDLGLVYCDFKPDNLIQVGDAVKLIDLGGVRRLDDDDSAIYGTAGYQAPEVPHVGPSVASDIYTIGRTLAVLAMEFRGYQTTYVASLPPVDETPLFRQHDSFYRLLLKACAPDPADRFVSADELRVQLLGVLREVVAAGREGAAEHSTSSLLFDVPTVADDSLDWQDLPRLRTDDGDPQMPWLRTVSIDDPVQRLAALEGAPANSPEVLLARARAALEAGQLDRVDDAVRRAAQRRPVGVARRLDVGAGRPGPPADGRGPGRVQRGLRAGARRAGAEAGPGVRLRDRRRHRRGRVALRGLRPHRRQLHRAGRLRPGPDPLRPRRRRRARSARSTWCPSTSRAFTQARRRRAGLLAGSGGGLPSLAAGAGQHREPHDRPRRPVPLPRRGARARRWAWSRRTAPTPRCVIGGRPAAEPALRDGLEAAYRDLAGYASTREERVAPRRPGQRGAPLDAAMTPEPVPDAGNGAAAAVEEPPGCGARSARRARARWRPASGSARPAGPTSACRPRPPRRLPRPRRLAPPTADPRSPARSPATSAGATSPTTATARSAGRGRRASATTSASSRPLGGRGLRPRRPPHPQRGRRGPRGRARPGHAVLVVCDGVSTSTDSDVASLAAARAARDVLATLRATGAGVGRRAGRREREGPGGGDGRGQRGRHRQHHRGPGQPGILHVRRGRGGPARARRRLGRRQPGLLAARRRRRRGC